MEGRSERRAIRGEAGLLGEPTLDPPPAWFALAVVGGDE